MMNLSDKLLRILRARAPFDEERLAAMTEQEGWAWVYEQSGSHVRGDQICFTGFSAVDCERLEARARATGWLQVVGSVTSKLAYLCVGPNPGPSKLEKAQARKVAIIEEAEFLKLVADGEVPRG